MLESPATTSRRIRIVRVSMSNENAKSRTVTPLQAVKRVAAIVSQNAGIQLGEKQFSMVESRLRSRMRKLKMESFEDYMVHLEANRTSESLALLSLLTTHHTFFFREFNHFEFLLNNALNPLINRARARGDKKIRVWSAACSRGQEVYSLAMFLHFHLTAVAPDISFDIVGTDVDPDSVKWAKNGVYRASELKQAPSMYMGEHWVRGKGDVADYFKVRDGLRRHCRFESVNLLTSDNFLKDKSFDLIFCRNVFIYFDSNQIRDISKRMLEKLDPDGFLILGVSESLNGLGLKVESPTASVYRHPQAREKSQVASGPAVLVPVATRKGPAKVLCVDDSPVILALMKKVFAEDREFTLVGTAKNGLEALEFLKKNKVDVMTLDLHMPEMDGIGFLAANQDKTLPIVVMSAISRDEPSIAQKALMVGALDYVEKPSLENIAQATNEIRSKLKSAMAVMAAKTAKSNQTLPSAAGAGASVAPARASITGEPPTKRTNAKKRVLIVDDSATIRNLLTKILSADPGLEVVGAAEKPSQVEELIKSTSPDVITLDIHMPEMDGVELLRRLQPKYKIPTLMITSVSKDEGPEVLQALELGAVDYIQKPEMSSLSEASQQIRECVRTAAHSRVRGKSSGVKRKARRLSHSADSSIVVMGASTGGTEAIREVLEALPSQIPPILIVQHIPGGFSTAFAKRLNDLVPFEVKEATDGDEVRANRVLIAPGGLQMGVRAVGGKLIVQVLADPPVNRHAPSVDYLFRSVDKLDLSHVVAVLMTGMGADGADGMKSLRRSGARTLAQDEASCVVFGMPREAIRLGGVEFVKPLDEIAGAIVDLVDAYSAANKGSNKVKKEAS